ncbi:hypothetical protein EJF18_20475 [Clavispora lusitaniae]|uniref:Uncharacterized protein n=3 Tax=Clavispora lusitaniae TaxID=36911 RepID=C4Y0F9_CLAL4|nr:uncharacterized protein CLUG_01691 [Clavispora lusitaniae ATCC 42720]KAF5212071.1 hypothetical protein E0198_001627 [Clavispora lusitaniae]EEQ37568.1 hypothetical protein CLUG_01691 [Clavispora lusitaniae ATCC 42720]KAF7583473.1 hypothetical protein FOB63_001691 [Clavispora lusitaniae]OVF07431.1 hypothetical protein A9F13_13g01364 [Clavispora lusitaniae]QFZ26570.1 hypothetical protein EJF14_20475 [Clavispora lusitaniae]
MFGLPIGRNNGQSISSPPTHFRDSARNAIYQQLPVSQTSNPAPSIRSAPSQFKQYHHSQKSHRSSASSVFSWSKRSVRSAPSIYSSSTATIPEDSEQTTTTVEQLINDIALHESYAKEEYLQRKNMQEKPSFPYSGVDNVDDDAEYKISLGSDLNYQNVPESLVDWNLNVTRGKLMLVSLPMVSSSPDLSYSNQALPQLVGDLAQKCQIVLLQPYITDKEFIYALYSSNLYQEHDLDANFKKSVAEISVKQSRLLQINQPKRQLPSPPITPADQTLLTFHYKEIALRNYLVNLAAAATTAYEYKLKNEAIKKELRLGSAKGEKRKLTKEEKKALWDEVRSNVFERAGLEE